MTTENTSIATPLAIPATRTILLAEIPNLDARVGNPQLKPHLGNFSPRSLVQFGVFQPAVLDKVDARLRALPPQDGFAR